MKNKMSYLVILLLFSCKTNHKYVCDFVSLEKFNYEYKKELLYKCINTNANDLLKQEIELENKTLPYFYPPPPFYIKQFSNKQDSLVKSVKISNRVLFGCLNSFDNEIIEKEIKKDYYKEIIFPKAE
jgi:hypothetical protein